MPRFIHCSTLVGMRQVLVVWVAGHGGEWAVSARSLPGPATRTEGRVSVRLSPWEQRHRVMTTQTVNSSLTRDTWPGHEPERLRDCERDTWHVWQPQRDRQAVTGTTGCHPSVLPLIAADCHGLPPFVGAYFRALCCARGFFFQQWNRIE